MRESTRSDSQPRDGSQPDLTKLVFSLLGLYLGYWILVRVADVLIYRHLSQSVTSALERYFLLIDAAYTGRALILLLGMLVFVWLFRPVLPLLTDRSKSAGNHTLLYDVLTGVVCGIVGFGVTLPLLGGSRATPLFSRVTSAQRPAELPMVLVVLLVGFLVPIMGELVFRGIAQRKFLDHMNAAAAIMVSAVLGASLWSLFNFPSSLVLGTVCGVLLWWRGNILPPIIADVVMTLSSCAYLGLKL